MSHSIVSVDPNFVAKYTQIGPDFVAKYTQIGPDFVAKYTQIVQDFVAKYTQIGPDFVAGSIYQGQHCFLLDKNSSLGCFFVFFLNCWLHGTLFPLVCAPGHTAMSNIIIFAQDIWLSGTQ